MKDNQYIFHVMNYFSRYFLAISTFNINCSDVIKSLQDFFTYFSQSTVVYCDRKQHFDNQKLKNFFIILNLALILNLSDSFKSIRLIKKENRILKNVIKKAEVE